MAKPPIFVPGVIAALALAATGVYFASGWAIRQAGIAPTQAQGAGQAPSKTQDLAQGWSAHDDGHPSHAPVLELHLLGEASVSLRQALAIAQRDAPGKPLGGFLDDVDGKPAYRIRVLKGDESIVTERIDAASGQATQLGPAVAERDWTAFDRLTVANLDQSPINLASAIAVAQQGRDGRVVDADVSDLRGVLRYDVVLVARSQVYRLSIAPDKALASGADASTKPQA